MTISAAQQAALNKISNTVTELAEGYNDLSEDILLGDVIENTGVSGVATLAASTSTVVANTSVQAGDQIFLQAQDAAGAALVAAATGVFVDPANIVVGVSFQIDHPAAAGTEVFAFNISR